jgi:hypothetical protein
VISASVEQGTSQVLLGPENLAEPIRCPLSEPSSVLAPLKTLNGISPIWRRRSVMGPKLELGHFRA